MNVVSFLDIIFTHSLFMDFILKGWRNERVIDMLSLKCGHVVLVLKDDPPAHIKKVQ